MNNHNSPTEFSPLEKELKNIPNFFPEETKTMLELLNRFPCQPIQQEAVRVTLSCNSEK